MVIDVQLLLLDIYYHEIRVLKLSIMSTEHKGQNPGTTTLIQL